MDMGVQNVRIIKSTEESIRSTEIKSNDIFKKILEREKEKVDDVSKRENEKKYDDSNSIKLFGEILNLDMKSNKEAFTKENGKLNVMDILDKYGDNVDTKGLNKLVSVINALHKENLLDDKDYFLALRWISNKIFEKSLKVIIDKKKFSVIESLDKE